MDLFGLNGCCGIREIGNLGEFATPQEALDSALFSPEDEPLDRPFVIFSGVVKDSRSGRKPLYAQRFAKFLRDNDLGDVSGGITRVNPNSGNDLKVYLWTVNQRNLARYRKRRAKEVLKGHEKVTKLSREVYGGHGDWNVDVCSCGDRFCHKFELHDGPLFQ